MSPAVGKALADGVVAAVAAAEPARAPFRCAEIADAPQAPADGGVSSGRALTIEGDVLRVAPALRAPNDRTLVVGVVADARGATPATLAQVARAREAFVREKVELVVSLGGMGTAPAELEATLRALAADAPWIVWAIPGDRESIPAHRAAVTALHNAGLPVFDGARVRLVEADRVALASYPGVEHPTQLLAGTDGCVHRTEDAGQLAARLAAFDGMHVWAGHTPPRQDGDGASDVTLGGVHVGSPALAAALPAARAHVVLHGLVDHAALGALRGQVRVAPGAAPVVLGAGPIEAMPIFAARGAVVGGSALVVRVSDGAVSWTRVRLPIGGATEATR